MQRDAELGNPRNAAIAQWLAECILSVSATTMSDEIGQKGYLLPNSSLSRWVLLLSSSTREKRRVNKLVSW